jgi:Na+(H+)/acetate symporter ActP
MTTVVYGLVATTIAWQANIGSVLQLLLLGYAMVVPPAIAIAYIFYWKKTTEKAAFFGILAGYLGGLLHWGLNTLFGGVEHASSGGFGQFWYQLCLDMGEWQDPTFSATIIPLIAIPLLTWFTQGEEDPLQRPFYRDISGQSAATVAA